MGLGRTARITILSLLALALAGSANAAGYWQVFYDFAPSSTNTTINPGGTFVDPVGGIIEIQYDAASSGAPLSGARLVGGNTSGTINQNAGILLVTGTNNTVLSPPAGGTPGTLAGSVLNLAVVANSTTTGFLHCYDATGPGGVCSAFFGTPASTPIPQDDTGPFTFPNFTFTGGTAGFGDFVAPTVTMMPQPMVTTMTKYIGRELSRTWVEAVGAPSMGVAGCGLLVAGMVFSGFNRARRRS